VPRLIDEPLLIPARPASTKEPDQHVRAAGAGGVEAYRARFHALLDAEEEQIIADTNNYDMFEVSL